MWCCKEKYKRPWRNLISWLKMWNLFSMICRNFILQTVYTDLQLSQPIVAHCQSPAEFNPNDFLTHCYESLKRLTKYEPGHLCVLCASTFMARPLSIGSRALALTEFGMAPELCNLWVGSNLGLSQFAINPRFWHEARTNCKYRPNQCSL